MKKQLFLLIACLLSALCFTSCSLENNDDSHILADYVQEHFRDIDQHRSGRPLSLDEAEAALYCWAFDGGFDDITPDELEEAISVVLACTDDIRELIYGMDEIDIEDIR